MTKKIIFITILAFIVRLYSPNCIPLNWDEASIGYNAYSILKTGRDEYGQFLPLIFKSFGDYKPGFYIYLTIPFIYLLGLIPLSVRLPSIIFGSLSPLILYLLVLTLNPKNKKIALISALLLAMTPFHIHFSRQAWETNVFTFQLLLASYCFIKFIQNHKLKYMILSSLIFGLSLYTYQSAKLISLLLIIPLFFMNTKTISNKYKTIFTYFVLPLFLFLLPITIRLLTTSDSNRLKVLSVFSYPKTELENSQLKSFSTPFQYRLFNNNYIYFGRYITSKYLNHLSPYFLFNKGDWSNPRHSAIYSGVLLLPSIIFLPLGLASIKIRSKTDIFFLSWLIIAPIPSALTRDPINAVRSSSLVIPLTYFTSQGFTYFLSQFKKRKKLLILTTWLAYVISFVYYIDLYFNHTVKTNPSDYLYGYRQAIEYIQENGSKFQNIYLSDFYGQPYIFYLFFNQYPPQKYQTISNLITTSADVGKVEKIDNIYFSTHQFSEDETHNLSIYSKDEVWRQQLDKLDNFKDLFQPIGVINNQAQFYAFPKN